MTTFAEQRAVVSGGGSGIGAAVARGLVNAGAKVTILGRSTERLKKAASDIGCEWIACDVTEDNHVEAAFAEVGPISILVNNAGVAVPAPFHRSDVQQWKSTIDVNLLGVVRCTQAALPNMVASKWGRIVNVASTAALVGYRYVSAYCAAKHAVVGLTRALALEVANKGVTVNAVCPGYTDTQIVADSIQNIVEKTNATQEQALKSLTDFNPQGRLVTPEEVAATVVFLSSKHAAAINGQAIAVDGGETQ